MPIKRKTRNLPNTNDQVSFFDPVYPDENNRLSDDDNTNDFLAEGIPRSMFRKGNKDQLNETNDTDTLINNEQDLPSDIMSPARIVSRIKDIQLSMEQAQSLLDSMETFKTLMPNNDDQREKLIIIIANLQEQQASYIKLLNMVTRKAEEYSMINNQNSVNHQQPQINSCDDEYHDDLSLRHNVQSPVRPRIESKMGFLPQTTTSTVSQSINLSDTEQANRNDNSNYDSLVGSLKSDTINWKDHQSTSADEVSDGESEKEIEKNLMLQKEQLRALQGQKKALIALKKRSEKRLQEQQGLMAKKNMPAKKSYEENDLLSDINSIRDRLKLLRNLYEEKHQVEIQQIKNSSNKPQKMAENRLKNLEHVRERLDELEQIVTYYQVDLDKEEDEDISSQLNELQSSKGLKQQKAQPDNLAPRKFNEVSNELVAKRLELEQAKSSLAQLQQMIRKIQPDEYPSSVHSTPLRKQSSPKNDTYEVSTDTVLYTPSSTQQAQNETLLSSMKSSLLSNMLSPRQVPQPLPISNDYMDNTIVAQHREIERLVESRQRLHTIKDKIVSLKQTMTTPPIQSKSKFSNEKDVEHERLNHSDNIRSSYKSNRQDNYELEPCPFDSSSDDEEANDPESDLDENGSSLEINYFFPTQQEQSHVKQSNLCASQDETEKQDPNADELSRQMSEMCRCLSAFIEEQKSFNRHIEQQIVSATPRASTNSPLLQTADSVFSQLQQQTLTQGLIVNLNAAYREIAVLQSEINSLQSENDRLTSSMSFDNQHRHQFIPQSYPTKHSIESPFSLNQLQPSVRPKPRSRFDESLKKPSQSLTTNNIFENSSKLSFTSQSTGKQTAIHVQKGPMKSTTTKQERNGKI